MPGPSSVLRYVRTFDPQWSFAVYWKLMQDALPSGFSTWTLFNSLSSLELIMALQGLGGSQWLASVRVPENALGWDLRHLALLQAARLWWDKDNLFSSSVGRMRERRSCGYASHRAESCVLCGRHSCAGCSEATQRLVCSAICIAWKCALRHCALEGALPPLPSWLDWYNNVWRVFLSQKHK